MKVKMYFETAYYYESHKADKFSYFYGKFGA